MYHHRFLPILALALVLALPGLATAAGAWAIDDGIKFHFAFFVPTEPAASGLFENVPVAALTPDSEPAAADIDNIALEGIRGLGFPLPAAREPGSFTFFLKFFSFPESISSIISTKRVTADYLLHRLPSYARLRSYLLQRDHLLVKKGFIAPAGRPFSAESPYPPLLMPKSGLFTEGRGVSSQEYFDGNLPFVSLYLTPAVSAPAGITDEENAAWSCKGVLAFHRDLLEAYERNLEPNEGSDGTTHRYFRVPAAPGARTVSIIRIPREPLVFTANWRDLPMPQNPKKVFLSALLLVYRHDYDLTADLPPGAPLSGPGFEAVTRLRRAQVLEVGSVVRIP